VADVPRVFDGIVMRGLNRQRDARYNTAREFAVALEDLVGVATNRQIGDWVEHIAAEELVARAQHVQELESQTKATDRRSVERIADATVKRRRRKRLASQNDEDGQLRTLEEEDGLDAVGLDPPTEIEDAFSEAATGQRAKVKIADPPTEAEDEEGEVDEEELKVTRVGGGMASAAARARAVAEAKRNAKNRETHSEPGNRAERGEKNALLEDEDLRRTNRWRREELVEDEKSEVETGINDSDRVLEGASPLPSDPAQDEISTDEDVFDAAAADDEATVDGHGPKPSDFRPRSPNRSSAPPSMDLALPVNSNRWFVVLLVLAALGAAVAAIVKMTRG
jgi:hypothetical protein